MGEDGFEGRRGKGLTRKVTRKQLIETFKEKKMAADRLWDRAYQSVLAGVIDLRSIVEAMDTCDIADKALMSIERRK